MISYDPDRGPWRVVVEGDPRVHAAEHLRLALAEATGDDNNAEWILAIETELEGQFEPQQPLPWRAWFPSFDRRD
jgi:hypothetical protein